MADAPGTPARRSATALRPRDEVSRFSSPQRAEMGARGSLEVEDKALRRIAQAAVLEVPGVAPTAATGTLGAALGRSHPRVDVQVAGRRARAEVEVVTAWPLPAADVAAAVRDHVGRRLHELADLDVDAVAVTVSKVVRVTAPQRRRVQ